MSGLKYEAPSSGLSGSGSFTVGAEVDRTAEAGIATLVTNSGQIIPLDPTKATAVFFQADTFATYAQIGSWTGMLGLAVPAVATTGFAAVQAIIGPGESYYVGTDGGLQLLIERTLG